MFEKLSKYKHTDQFVFSPNDNLKKVCNAPHDKSGVYIVNALIEGKVELFYIGCSGKIDKLGKLKIRKSGLGGIKDRIVNGHQFGKVPRRISWVNQMKNENLEKLIVYWYITHNEIFCDCPRTLEKSLLQIHLDIFGRLPKWNNKL